MRKDGLYGIHMTNEVSTQHVHLPSLIRAASVSIWLLQFLGLNWAFPGGHIVAFCHTSQTQGLFCVFKGQKNLKDWLSLEAVQGSLFLNFLGNKKGLYLHVRISKGGNANNYP